MIIAGVICALFAAVVQTIVHAILKSGGDRLALRTVTCMVAGTAVLPLACVVPPPQGELVWWLALSVVVHVTYQLVLIQAYKAFDFSVAYPLARGVVPIATALAGAALLGDRLSLLTGVGIVVVSGGLLIAASSTRLQWAGSAAAVIAGLLTATYSIVDAKGMRVAPDPATFIVWFFLLEGLALSLVSLGWYRRQLLERLWDQPRLGIASGLLSVLAYSASLTAFKLLLWEPRRRFI